MGNLLCCRNRKSKRVENPADGYYIAENGDSKWFEPATGKRLAVVQTVPSYRASTQQQTFRYVPKQEAKCAACGELGHSTESCRYFTRLCFYCRQEGHVIRICPKRKRAKQRNASRTHSNGSVYYAVSIREPRITHVKQKQKRHHATGVRRKARTPVGTVIALGTVEDFADDDTLKRRNNSFGCNDILYHIICCCL